jgi:glycosyltransferase involved in cell wall biosynthesis
MKILHIIIGLNVGGAENSLKRLIEIHKDNQNYQHCVISLTTIGKIGEQLQASGIEVKALGMTSAFSVPITLWRLIKSISYINPDIVHTWMYHADLLGGLAAYFTQKKVIWSIRNTHVAVGSGTAKTTKYIMQSCAKLSYKIPSKIICVANAAKVSHYKYYNKKMIVIPNGYAIDAIQKIAKNTQKNKLLAELKIRNDKLIIGSIGRFNDYKDFPTFIKAANILLASQQNLQFLLIGRDIDSNNKILMSLISDTVNPNAFILLGERNNIPELLSLMDIFCLHSVSEGFPNVLGEAMCVGLPCVTTDVGDAALMVGEHGSIVPHSNPEKLAAALQVMIDQTPQERTNIGQALSQRIRNHYSIANIQKAYETLYHEVVNS